MADAKLDRVLVWGLAGSTLNLAGVALLLISGVAGAGSWRLWVSGALIVTGALCTAASFRFRRHRTLAE